MPVLRLSHALAAAALLALSACGADRDRPARNASEPTPSGPSPSGVIAFERDHGGTPQLFTIRADGSGERQITREPGSATAPDWSPDGRRLVYQWDRPDENGCAIRIINADGSGLRDLSGAKHPCDMQPAFVPDGRRIVFVRYDDRADTETIMSMDLRGRHVRRIGGRLGDTDPNVSPDGRTVTFVRAKGEGDDLRALFSVRMNGSRLRQLTPFKFNVAFKHAWSPDGRRILFTRNAEWADPLSSSNVNTIAPDGSGLSALTRFEGGPTGDNATAGTYSPDARHIALRFERNGEGVLAIMEAEGGNLRRITRPSTDLTKAIDWGPGSP